MKNLYYSDIKRCVKARLDELSNNDDASLVADSGAVQDLDKEIEAVVLPSVRKIHLDAPNILLKGGLSLVSLSIIITSSLIGGTSYYKVSFGVPSGTAYKPFLRLVSLALSDWERPIQTLFGEDSAEYRKQRNRYLMGTPERPMGFLLHGASGNGVIELYSTSSASPTMTVGLYIPEPQKLGTVGAEYVEVADTLDYPCLNQITAETLRSLGRHQEADLYDRLAVQPFYIDADYARKNPVASERINIIK